METWCKNNIIDSINAIVFAVDYDTHKILYSNKLMNEDFGKFDRNSLCHSTVFGCKSECSECPMNRLKNGEANVTETMWSEPSQKWLQMEYKDCLGKNGKHYCICTGVDVSDIKKSINMTEKVLDGINAAAYSISNDYQIVSYNMALKKMLPEIEVGMTCYKTLWNNDEPCSFCPRENLTFENPYAKLELFNHKLNRFLSIDCAMVNDLGNVPLYIFTGYDITKDKQYEEQLKQIAYKDVQLNIKNQNAYIDDLSSMFINNITGYSCVISLKNFNNFNLIYGRDKGDVILENITKYLSTLFPVENLYRVAGAKFAFLSDNYDEFQELLDKLNRPIPKNIMEKDMNFHFYIDAVVIEFPKFGISPEIVMHNVEYLLKKTKSSNTSNLLYFDENEQGQLERSKSLVNVISRNLEEEKFLVFYQPIYNFETKSFSKCEALLRLYDDDLGWISPGEFIPVAEKNGYIGKLGMFVLSTVCAEVEKRKKNNLPPIQFNVNVSAIQFSNPMFADKVINIIEKYDIDPSLIQLEVTESIMINSFDYIIDIMQKLIEFGLSFSVDDFGTGYSSLSYIGTLPVESIKLDKSFIDKITESDVYVLIVKNIIEIAKGLKFKIVAEGVEGQNQLEILHKLGCDFIQGFFFSKPLPYDEFEKFIAEQNE